MGSSIGSTLDVKALVAELMKLEQKPLNKLKQDEANDEVQLSIYGQLKNYMEGVTTALNKLSDAFNTVSYKASVSNSTSLSAQITSSQNVYAGTHALNVTQLASAETLASVTQFTSKSNALSLTGNLTFTVNGSAYTVTLSATDSLEKIRDKINVSTANVGVVASIVASTSGGGADQYALVVASEKTGLANKVVITGTAAATFDFTNELSEAKNAIFTFDGANVVRASNNINDVMDGVNFNLLTTGSSNLIISAATEDLNNSITQGLANVVSAYNQVISFIDQNQADRRTTDSTINILSMTLKNIFRMELEDAGDFKELIEIGIKTAPSTAISSKTGKPFYSINKLELDQNKLKAVLQDNFTGVKNLLLDATHGFVKLANTKIDKMVRIGGAIYERTVSLQDHIRYLATNIDKEQGRLDHVQDELTQKYSVLNSMLDKFSQISGFLEQQFNSINPKK